MTETEKDSWRKAEKLGRERGKDSCIFDRKQRLNREFEEKSYSAEIAEVE